MTELSINYLSEDGHAVISTDERKWVNRIYKLAEEHPDEVEITTVFKDGFVTAHIPKSWIKVKPPAKRSLTEEQREAYVERMRMARLTKFTGDESRNEGEEEDEEEDLERRLGLPG